MKIFYVLSFVGGRLFIHLHFTIIKPGKFRNGDARIHTQVLLIEFFRIAGIYLRISWLLSIISSNIKCSLCAMRVNIDSCFPHNPRIFLEWFRILPAMLWPLLNL